MILWIALFVLVLAISFFLALKSMKDYQEIPTQLGGDFSLFLIRNNQGLNEQFFNLLYSDLSESGSNISFERLVKGQESAIVVFGSSQLLNKYKDSLNLLELEDYTNTGIEGVSAWEVGIKEKGEGERVKGKVFENMPELADSERFWWQVILWVNKDAINSFQTQIRAVVYSSDKNKRKELTQKLQKVSSQLVKLPKAFSDDQLIDFYKKRSFPGRSKNKSITSSQVRLLLL